MISWNIVRFIFFALLQALVVSNLDIASGWVMPYIYPFALLMLPFESPRWLFMSAGFIMGFMVDCFAKTWGMHTSACVFLGFLQPYVLQVIAPREGYEAGVRPTIQGMGFNWYLVYAGLLILPFHIWLGLVEVFSLDTIISTLGRAVLSSAAALMLMILGQYLMFTPKAAAG